MITNIKTLSYLLAITGGLMLINIVLGSINGAMQERFNWKKFLFGVLKALVNALCVLGTCCLADLFSQVLNMIEGIEISAQIVSVIEILSVVVAWDIDLFNEVFEKIKSLKTMKYVSYEEVKQEIPTKIDGEVVM